MKFHGDWAVFVSRLRALADRGEKFLRWWLDELLGLLPERWQQHFYRRNNLLLIELDEQACHFRFGEVDSAETFAEVPLGEEGALPLDSVQQLESQAAKAEQIILLLSPHRVLRKLLSLPAATEVRLENVLRFEMDRYTPFSCEQVFFGYRVVGRDYEKPQIEVELQVVQRDYLEPLLATLAQRGISPSIVALAGSLGRWPGAALNLLPSSFGAASRAMRWEVRRRRLALGALVVLVAIGGPLYLRGQSVESLQSELEELKGKAEESRSLGNDIQRLEAAQRFLLEKQAKSPRALLLLNELTALLPDHTSVTRFQDNARGFRLDGESGEASALIGLLEGSALMENVRFASPVTSNPSTQKDRFSLVADLSQAEPAP